MIENISMRNLVTVEYIAFLNLYRGNALDHWVKVVVHGHQSVVQAVLMTRYKFRYQKSPSPCWLRTSCLNWSAVCLVSWHLSDPSGLIVTYQRPLYYHNRSGSALPVLQEAYKDLRLDHCWHRAVVHGYKARDVP